MNKINNLLGIITYSTLHYYRKSANMYYKPNPSSACIVYLHCWPQLG